LENKNLYSAKLENEEEIDKFLDTYDSPKLNQEVIKNLEQAMRLRQL
jgi:hypothetical protein